MENILLNSKPCHLSPGLDQVSEHLSICEEEEEEKRKKEARKNSPVWGGKMTKTRSLEKHCFFPCLFPLCDQEPKLPHTHTRLHTDRHTLSRHACSIPLPFPPSRRHRPRQALPSKGIVMRRALGREIQACFFCYPSSKGEPNTNATRLGGKGGRGKEKTKWRRYSVVLYAQFSHPLYSRPSRAPIKPPPGGKRP